MISNKQIAIVMSLFSVATVIAFLGGYDLGEKAIQPQVENLTEKYFNSQYDDNLTARLLTLADTQITNLNPYQYLDCLKSKKIDNVTISVNNSRSSFPSSDWFYGDDKLNCLIKSQNGNDTELRVYQNLIIDDNYAKGIHPK